MLSLSMTCMGEVTLGSRLWTSASLLSAVLHLNAGGTRYLAHGQAQIKASSAERD